MKTELWIGVAELKALTAKATTDILHGAAGVFTNIITWASTPGEFRRKVDTMAATYELYVVSVEGEEPVSVRLSCTTVDEEIADLIRQAELNPNAILFGTFYSYPYNEA